MVYNLVSTNGLVTIAPETTLVYKDMELIGRDSINWNEPIQQNFVTIADKVEALEADSSYSDFESAFNTNK